MFCHLNLTSIVRIVLEGVLVYVVDLRREDCCSGVFNAGEHRPEPVAVSFAVRVQEYQNFTPGQDSASRACARYTHTV